MVRSTGPIITAGGITLASQVLAQNKPVDWRIPIATGMAAGFLALIEKLSESAAVGIAYMALITTMFLRPAKNKPAPIEAILKKLGLL